MSSVEDQPEDEVGATLPGVAGAVQAAANSKAGTALTLPAATAFGAFFGEWAEATTDRWRAKRASNVKAHKARVDAQRGHSVSEKDLSERQARAAVEWLEEAQRVDPSEEPEISAVWQGLLDSIYSKSATAERMVASVKGLDEQQIRLFLSVGKGWTQVNSEMQRDVKILVDRGLVVKADFMLLMLPVMLGAIGVIVGFMFGLSNSNSILASRTLTITMWSVVVFVCSALPFATFYVLRSYRLTETGRIIKRQAARYLASAVREHSDTPKADI